MIKNKKLPDFFINAFYESKFRNSLFVIKASGSIIENDESRNNLISNIRELTHHGIKIILIYGGGHAIDMALKERGIEVKKDDGRRITNSKTIKVIREVIGGDISLSICESMQKNNLRGLSFNAIPSCWMHVVPRPKKPIDFGYVGDIKKVNTRPIIRQLKVSGFIACSCLAINENGELCNINADTIATEIASGLSADKLIFMSNVDGVKVKGETATLITDTQIQGYIDDGTVTDGMKVKMKNCLRALKASVKRIHLINGLRENALQKEIFESVGPGTMLLREAEQDSYMNEVKVQKAIGGR